MKIIKKVASQQKHLVYLNWVVYFSNKCAKKVITK